MQSATDPTGTCVASAPICRPLIAGLGDAYRGYEAPPYYY
jgi:hypothetical protein